MRFVEVFEGLNKRKPTTQEIASAIGVKNSQVAQLQNRGMPVHKIRSAREWFEKNGFTTIRHDKSGGAANSGPSMSTTMNAAIGKGRGVMPLIGERIRKRRDDNEAEKT